MTKADTDAINRLLSDGRAGNPYEAFSDEAGWWNEGFTDAWAIARAELADLRSRVAILTEALDRAEAQIDANERAMIEERRQQYGSAFRQEQLVAIQGMHRQQREGVKLVRQALSSSDSRGGVEP